MQVKHIRKSINHKKLLILSVFLIVVTVGFLTLEMMGLTRFTTLNSAKTPEQIQQDQIDSENKKDFVDGKNTGPNIDMPIPEPTVDDITISADKESDGRVTITTQLKNYSDGTCNLTITNDGDTYNQTVPVIYQPSFSTCAGFSIPINNLDDGTWNISLEIISKGKTNTKSISVEIK